MALLEATANFIGKDGFNWWMGQVENNGSGKNKDETGKVQVRILGYHTKSKKSLKTEDLPWATVMMPSTAPQTNGIGTVHQLEKGAWVIGFFMDGAAAQIPIVMGTIGDNHLGEYGEESEEEGFKPIVSPNYDKKKHGDKAKSLPPGTGTEGGKTATAAPATGKGSSEKRGEPEKQSEAQKGADKRKCYIVNIANGKCGSEAETKIGTPLNELFAFGRNIEKNSIGEFINKNTGKVEDFVGKIQKTANRIQSGMSGLLSGIKGWVLRKVQKFIREEMDKIKIPNPDILQPVKKQLKSFGDLIACLFDQILAELGNFIMNLLLDLVGKILDTALCLVQEILGKIMSEVMKLLQQGLGILSSILGQIKGAVGLIQGLINKVAEFLDLFCNGAVSCAVGASVFKTCQGEAAEGKNAAEKEKEKYAKQPPPNGSVIGNGKPNAKGYVPWQSSDGRKYAFNTKTGDNLPLDGGGSSGAKTAEDFKKETGIDNDSFDTRGPLDKFEDFVDSLGPGVPLDCSNNLLNKSPCFPEMVFDALRSSTAVKALPIIDSAGSIVGSLVQKAGGNIPNLGLDSKVRALATCNEQEGSGATFKPIIRNGTLAGVDVLTPGIGYGFSTDTTFCPREEYFIKIVNNDLKSYVVEGSVLNIVKLADGTVVDNQPEILQVADTDYKGTGEIALATIKKEDESLVQPGMVLTTSDGYEFTLNFTEKFIDFFIPPNATAIWAECPDLIPILEDIVITNVGEDYVEPKIFVGDQEVGKVTVDSRGRLVKPTITTKVIGFVEPRIEPPGPAVIVPRYTYTGPERIKELLKLETYIDCVGHPSVKI